MESMVEPISVPATVLARVSRVRCSHAMVPLAGQGSEQEQGLVRCTALRKSHAYADKPVSIVGTQQVH